MAEYLNWAFLYCGKITRQEIQEFVKDEKWQQVRISMKGKSLGIKFETLWDWLDSNEWSRKAQVQVTNYITALSRGGLIKPEDYLEEVTK